MKTVSIAALIVIVISGLGIFAWIKSKQLQVKVDELNTQKVLTQKEADEANKQKSIAEQNAQNAKEQEKKAIANANEANRQGSIAQQNALEAKKQSEKADANAREASRQQGIAQANETLANAAKADAEARRKLAEDQKSAFLKNDQETALAISRIGQAGDVSGKLAPVWQSNLKFLDNFKKDDSEAGQQIAVLQTLNYMLL
jgi:alpha-galactosidase/6-phospho-beta-glucosidase family protein